MFRMRPAHSSRFLPRRAATAAGQATSIASTVRVESTMRVLACLVFALFGTAANAAELPIFDAHVHYSHDAWENVPPKIAIELLRKAGIKRALVSSSNDEGNQKLLAEAPDLILSSLRPYRSRGEISTWVRDETVVQYLEERLAKH